MTIFWNKTDTCEGSDGYCTLELQGSGVVVMKQMQRCLASQVDISVESGAIIPSLIHSYMHKCQCVEKHKISHVLH